MFGTRDECACAAQLSLCSLIADVWYPTCGARLRLPSASPRAVSQTRLLVRPSHVALGYASRCLRPLGGLRLPLSHLLLFTAAFGR
jgi:hypothetical protein